MRRANVTDAVTRLGTEGAFAVLARARALEAEGHDVIHLEIGEPDFETPPHVAEAGIAAIRAGETHYCQTAGLPVLREAAAASLAWSRGVAIDPQNVLVANGAKPFLFFTVLATGGPGDEVIYPDPGLPDLRVGRSLRRSDADPAAVAGGSGLQLRSGRAREPPQRADEARDPERAPEPDRWRDPTRRPRTGGRGDRAHAGVGAHRRGVLPDHLRRRRTVDCLAPRDARPHDPPRRILEDVLDDGVAARLRSCPARPRRPSHAPHRQLDVMCAALRPARGRRRARRSAGRGHRDGGRVPPPAGLPRASAEHDPGNQLYRARWCVLRVPERLAASTRRRHSSQSGCSSRRASRCSRGAHSASTRPTTCASPTPPRSRTSNMPSSASACSSRRWAADPGDAGVRRRSLPRRAVGRRRGVRDRGWARALPDGVRGGDGRAVRDAARARTVGHVPENTRAGFVCTPRHCP